MYPESTPSGGVQGPAHICCRIRVNNSGTDTSPFEVASLVGYAPIGAETHFGDAMGSAACVGVEGGTIVADFVALCDALIL